MQSIDTMVAWKALTSLTAATNAPGDEASSSAACMGEVDHTMLLYPCLTGSNARGPVGRNLCQAVACGSAVRTVATSPFWSYIHCTVRSWARLRMRERAPSAAINRRVRICRPSAKLTMASFDPPVPSSAFNRKWCMSWQETWSVF